MSRVPVWGWFVITGVVLLLAGWKVPDYILYLRIGLVVLACVIAWMIYLSMRPGGNVSAVFAWVAFTDTKFDWRSIGITTGVLAFLVAVAVAPGWVWTWSALIGFSMLVGAAGGGVCRAAGIRFRQPTALPSLRAAGGAERRRIIRSWPRVARRALNLAENADADHKLPDLVRRSVRVTPQAIRLVMVPPPGWMMQASAAFATALTHEWSGWSPRVTDLPTKRMKRRQVLVEIAMDPLPDVVQLDGPIPVDEPRGVGVGVDLMREVAWLNLGPEDVPHVLVAGATGNGKSVCMRLIGAGYVALGHEVYVIDPKGEGDLHGIGAVEEVVDHAHIAELLHDSAIERDKRADRILHGEDPGPRRILLIDEARSLLTGSLSGGKPVNDKAMDAFASIAQMGRSSGIHLVTGIQQASAQGMGGNRWGTFVREQHHARILIGRNDPENVGMMLGDRPLAPADKEFLASKNTPRGRALVSGLNRAAGTDVYPVQLYYTPKPDSRPRRQPAQLTLEAEADPAGDAGPVLSERAVLDVLAGGVPMRRADVAAALGVSRRSSSLRDIVARLEEQGCVESSKDAGGVVVLRATGAVPGGVEVAA